MKKYLTIENILLTFLSIALITGLVSIYGIIWTFDIVYIKLLCTAILTFICTAITYKVVCE